MPTVTMEIKASNSQVQPFPLGPANATQTKARVRQQSRSRWATISQLVRTTTFWNTLRRSDYESVSVNKRSLRFVRADSTVAADMERSYAVEEARQLQALLQYSSLVFILFQLATMVRSSYEYAKNEDESTFLGMFCMHAVTAGIALFAIVYSRSKYYLTTATKVMSMLGFFFMASLVVYSLWLEDARYDFQILFMLYLFAYMPIQTYVGTAIAIVHIASFTLGHLLMDTEDSKRLMMKAFLMTCFLCFLSAESYRREFTMRSSHLSKKVSELQAKEMVEQEARSDILIRSMLPAELILELGKGTHTDESKLIAEYTEVTVLFFKIANFQELVKMLRADEVVHVLSVLWTKFDRIVDLHSTYKVETVGEEYLVASGCTGPEIFNHAQLCVNTALHMLDTVNVLMKKSKNGAHEQLRKLVPKLEVRLGLNTGPVVAGLVGMRFKLIGDTVNTASRMQSTSKPGRIQISETTYHKLVSAGEDNCGYQIEKQEPMHVKGKGIMQAYVVVGRRANPANSSTTELSSTSIDPPSYRRSQAETRRSHPPHTSAGGADVRVLTNVDKYSLEQAKLGDFAMELLDVKSPRAKELRNAIQQILLPSPANADLPRHGALSANGTQEQSLPLTQAIWLTLGYGKYSRSTVDNREDVANESLYQADQLDRALSTYRHFCGVAILIVNIFPVLGVYLYYPDLVDSKMKTVWFVAHSGVLTPLIATFWYFTHTRRFAVDIALRNRISIFGLFLIGCFTMFNIKYMYYLDMVQFTREGKERLMDRPNLDADVGGLALYIILIYHFKLITMLARVSVAMSLVCLYVLVKDVGTYSENNIARTGAVLLTFCLGQMVVQFLHEYTERLTFNSLLSNRVQRHLLEAAELHNDSLLRLRLPAQILGRLKLGHQIADHFSCVTVLQTDVVGFTFFSSTVTPHQLRLFVNHMFERFNAIVDRHQLYTVEIIGDAFLVVGGCPSEEDSDAVHAAKACAAALEFNTTLETLSSELPSIIGTNKGESAAAARSLSIRLGVHSGPIVAGVVGVKDPRYHVFGETVHIAQGMESQGVPGRIHCTQETASVLNGTPEANPFQFTPRPAEDLRKSAKYDGSYTDQTYFISDNRQSMSSRVALIED